jgi:hypothetical protein
MFFVIYKIRYIENSEQKWKKSNKKSSEKLKNYLSNSPEMNFSTFSYASSSVY